VQTFIMVQVQQEEAKEEQVKRAARQHHCEEPRRVVLACPLPLVNRECRELTTLWAARGDGVLELEVTNPQEELGEGESDEGDDNLSWEWGLQIVRV
jgi:hypothetical protein